MFLGQTFCKVVPTDITQVFAFVHSLVKYTHVIISGSSYSLSKTGLQNDDTPDGDPKYEPHEQLY